MQATCVIGCLPGRNSGIGGGGGAAGWRHGESQLEAAFGAHLPCKGLSQQELVLLRQVAMLNTQQHMLKVDQIQQLWHAAGAVVKGTS